MAYRVSHGVFCIGCEYDLRGINPTANCPECGLSVETSMQGNALALHGLAWVRRVANGAGWCAVGHAGYFVAILVGWFFPLLAWHLYAQSGIGAISGLVMGLAWAMALVPSVLGYWLMTTPPTATIERRRGLNSRVLARYGMAWSKIGLVMSFLGGIILSAQGPRVFSRGDWDVLAGSVAGSAVIVWPIGAVAGLIYQRRLALGIPQHALARQLRWLLVTFLVVAIVNVGGVILSNFTFHNPYRSGLYVWIHGAVCMNLAAAAGIWLWELILLLWLTRRLQGICRQLEQPG